jgi:hypothetical protein
MKRHFSVVALFVAATAMICVYLGCASQNSNSNANVVAMASPEPTPDNAAIAAELTRIENDWPRILKERDGAAVRRIEADDVFLVYPDGMIGSKDQDVKDIESGSLSADSMDVSDLTVKVLDKDSAVVRLRTTVRGGKYKAADGNTQDTSGQFRSVDTFARRNGQWQLVASVTVKVLAPLPSTSPTPKASPSVKPTPAAKPSPATKPSPAMKPVSKPSPPKTMSSPMKTKTP